MVGPATAPEAPQRPQGRSVSVPIGGHCDSCGGGVDKALWAAGLRRHLLCPEPSSVFGSTVDNTPPTQLTFNAHTPALFGSTAAPGQTSLGEELRAEITAAIVDYARNLPRSLQKHLGPSEIGHPCDRKIAYKLTDWPTCNDDGDPWPSLVGTAGHALLEKVFGQDKYAGTHQTETRVDAGVHGGAGSLDLFQIVRSTVIDHKLVGPTSMREYKTHGPSPSYRTQVHTYAYAKSVAGARVDNVAIAFYPRGGMLSGLYVWTEPYDESIATRALTRINLLEGLVEAIRPGDSPDRFGDFTATPDHCGWCPWYRPKSKDLGAGCPGDSSK